LIAHATAQLVQPNRQRRLVVNSIPTLAMHWLLPRLPQFQREHPDIELRLMTSDRDVSRLESNFDIALRRGPSDWPGYIAHPFLDEWELPLCSPQLLDRLPIQTPADLANHTLLYADTRPTAWQRWFTLAGVPELKAAATQQFDHFYLALQAAMDGVGVALGPMPMMQAEIDAGSLVAPLAAPVVNVRGYCWVIPRTSSKDPAVQHFTQWLEQCAQTTGLPVSTSDARLTDKGP
jgi:LysR family glycine cleavage system transcriptional activator